METLNNQKSNLIKAGFILLVILCLYFTIRTISEIKNLDNLPSGVTVNTMSFDGTGEVSAVPNLATISFTIDENALTVKDAQAKVTTLETAALGFLDKSGIAKSDIKTEDYSSYPKYQYQNSVCPQPMQTQSSLGVAVPNIAVYCPPSKQVLTGYEVSENISVQVHDLTKTGDIVAGIGAIGISNINGPNFSIDKEDQLNEQARKIAIDNAKAKAKTLAADLGVNLVRIVNFSENGNSPIMYKAMAVSSAAVAPAPSPVLPTGENKITSNVTITYEIR